MPKKIYDIVPPKVAKKMEAAKSTAVPVKKSKASNKPKVEAPAKTQKTPSLSKSPRKEKFSIKQKVWMAGALVILFFVVYFYNTLQAATITIYPKTSDLSLEEKITADASVQNVDPTNNIIPAQTVQVSQSGQQDFPATGSSSSDSKATGTITVYNSINPATPFTLIVGTHFLSDSGKYFVTLSKVTIPAAKYQGSKLVPGSVSVKVQAQDSGPDYNIGPSKFSAPKLSGTSYYYSISAESTTAMYGGYTGNTKQVSQDDITGAENTLSQSLFNKAKDALKAKLSSDQVLLDDATTKTISNDSSSVQAGSEADKFTESLTLTLSAVVFNKSDLENIIQQAVSSKLQDNQNLVPNSLNLNYTVDSIDTTKGTAAIDLQSSAKAYDNIDANQVVEMSSQKSANQIRESVSEQYGDSISSVKVSFWPFWTTQAPGDKNNIKVKFNFN